MLAKQERVSQTKRFTKVCRYTKVKGFTGKPFTKIVSYTRGNLCLGLLENRGSLAIGVHRVSYELMFAGVGCELGVRQVVWEMLGFSSEFATR